ncbi:hypothetical protein LTR56_023428 [Elasticomyces elasticus]|nr:hypothetical protein LTR56_023428 [Elasticomyces elasticus]KAK3625571.1 hypothetical protein LTR22_023502 [Elasticomyces elasticus]KAK4906718.1 hypothetical protein LTR49_024177 [Elasticomyces elasticus]KAK5746497.1 hypothetical protein LTS12_022732 [Elasticomyces elasticus]
MPSPRLAKLKRATESANAKVLKARSRQSALDRTPVVVQTLLKPAPPRLYAPTTTRPPTWYPANLNTRIAPAAPAASAARVARRAALQRLAPTAINTTSNSVNSHVVANARITTVRRRNVSKGPVKLPDWPAYGSLHDLQILLGQDGSSAMVKARSAAVFVSIDTESERHGLINNVVEVGITTLRVADIYGTEPGERIRNWSAAMEHYHIVLELTRKPAQRMRSSLFGRSRFMVPDEANATIASILHAAARKNSLPGIGMHPSMENAEGIVTMPPANLILVGQSIAGDITALKGRPLNITLQSNIETKTAVDDEQPHTLQPSLPHFGGIMDTLALTQHARKLGAELPSAQLGHVARALGVDPQYWDGSTVKGTHNASNDAAYTMMVLLLHAVRGDDLVKTGGLEQVPVEEPRRVAGWKYLPARRKSGWRVLALIGVGVVGSVGGLVKLALSVSGSEMDDEDT